MMIHDLSTLEYWARFKSGTVLHQNGHKYTAIIFPILKLKQI